MLGLGLQINKMVNRAGGLPPLASLLTFFSKQRDDTTVIDEISRNDAEIIGSGYLDLGLNNSYIPVYGTSIACDYVELYANFQDITSPQIMLGGIIFNGENCHIVFGSDATIGNKKRILIGSNESTNIRHSLRDFEPAINTWYAIKIYMDNGELKASINGVNKTLYSYDSSWVYEDGFTIARRAISTTYNFKSIFKKICIKNGGDNVFLSNFSSGDGNYIYDEINGGAYEIMNGGNWGIDIDYGYPYNIINGFSVIDGVVGEVPPLLGTQVDALGNPLTNPAISKISNLGNGYYKMPSDIKIGGLSLFNKDDPVIYDTNVSTTAGEYVSEDPYLWHVDELNTERILSYLNDAYKFTWFVKNTFTEGTYEPLTIKEIFAYSQKIEDADDLNKIKAYIGYNWS